MIDTEASGEGRLDAAALNRDLVRPGGLWREIHVVERTGSTNSDLLAEARHAAPEGRVLLAEHQDAGRGRLDRGFVTPPRSALTMSMLLRPRVPAARSGWLPLLAGVVAVQAVARASLVFARDTPELWVEPLGAARLTSAGRWVGLKWPNDVLLATDAAERKLAGILSEAAPGRGGHAGVVIGIGLNVRQASTELPTPTSVSLRAAGLHRADRATLVRELLTGFAAAYAAWQDVDGDAEACGLAEDYRAECATLGRRVRVGLLGGRHLDGLAEDVDDTGRLLVRDDAGHTHRFSSGDVVHVR